MTTIEFLNQATFWQWVGILCLLYVVGQIVVALVHAIKRPACRHRWRVLSEHKDASCTEVLSVCDICGDREQDELG